MTYPGGQQPFPGQPPQADQQPNYPPQQGYPQQPGYPPPGYPQQQGYPPPQQYGPPPGYPQQSPGQAPVAGPLTVPGIGAIVMVVGILLQLAAFFFVPWVTGYTYLDLIDVGSSDSWAASYVRFGGFAATGALILNPMLWTLGVVRTKKSALLLSQIKRMELTRENFWWYRVVFSGRAVVMMAIHIAGIAFVYYGNYELLGHAAGPWLMAGGVILSVVGTAIGPRPGPAMPA